VIEPFRSGPGLRSPADPRVVTPHETAAWVLSGAALLFVFLFHLVPGLVAGLLTYVILRRLAGHLTGPRLSHGRAKLLAAVGLAIVTVSLVSGLVLLLIGTIHGHVADIPAVFQRMAQALDDTSLWLESRGAPALVPDAGRDAAQLKAAISGWLRSHAEELRRTGGQLGRAVLHVIAGMAVSLLAFFRPPGGSAGPLADALAERVRRLAEAFEAVVFAQVKVSAFNTSLTALYLLVGLPLLGVRLPLAGTLVVMTFLTGLLPVVGNLLSNTVIVLISLGVSGWIALLSLALLVVIHKLEYVVNARIVGSKIQAASWELLAALFVFEAAFGLPGVVMAPIVYAAAKRELMDRGLV